MMAWVHCSAWSEAYPSTGYEPMGSRLEREAAVDLGGLRGVDVHGAIGLDVLERVPREIRSHRRTPECGALTQCREHRLRYPGLRGALGRTAGELVSPGA